ncbi:NUDIX domain-containing protein [Tabrizicola sp. BL-A-41-H6]|uniref:NUDIX domain-containing protein n=1 Tax=Tabrizicola sp. BL-A-41-H6 TaxID=3421107 RepID=UPI003D673D3F
MTSVWVVGGPCDARLRLAVLGREVAAVAGVVTGDKVPGALLRDLSDGEAGRLRDYATVMGAIWRDGPVETTAGQAQARLLDDCRDVTPEDVALADHIMRLIEVVAPDRLAKRLGSLRVEAASRARAQGSAVRGLRVGTGEVTEATRRMPHTGFFAVAEVALSYRRFDGEMSGQLTREIFVAGDAVTVLPYDPVRDRVLLIEQMRMGPYGRGDPLPWQLEAIAGRIDPGETPEDCARREAVEEAGLALGALEKVAQYYPSPGALSEYLYSYVALCDLPDGAAGVFGAAEESEDIRGHLMGFDVFMALVASGEVANAPLLLTALWLQRERLRLRG